MKLAIIGSRRCTEEQFNKHLKLLEALKPDEVISGGAVGVDAFAERWARERSIPCTVFKPDYEKYGAPATFIRNRQIVKNADMVIAFHDGTSEGTAYVVQCAKRRGRAVLVVNI